MWLVDGRRDAVVEAGCCDVGPDELNLHSHYDNVQILLSKASSWDRAAMPTTIAMNLFSHALRVPPVMRLNRNKLYIYVAASSMYHLAGKYCASRFALQTAQCIGNRMLRFEHFSTHNFWWLRHLWSDTTEFFLLIVRRRSSLIQVLSNAYICGYTMALEILAPIYSNVHVHFCRDFITITVIFAVTPPHFVVIPFSGYTGRRPMAQRVHKLFRMSVLLFCCWFFVGRSQARTSTGIYEPTRNKLLCRHGRGKRAHTHTHIRLICDCSK